MWFLILPVLLHCSVAFQVLTFNGTSSSKGALSIAYLVEELQIPDIFILCASAKQARFDKVGFISVSGKDSQDGWMRLRFER